MREHPNSLDKRDLMFADRKTGHLFMSQSKEHLQKRIELAERALALDPDYVWALATAARTHADFVSNGHSQIVRAIWRRRYGK